MDTYDAMMFRQSVEKQNEKKLADLKAKLEEFEEIDSLSEAKELIAKLEFNGKNVIFIGDAKCYIADEDDYVRVTVDSPTEFITYMFE